MINSNAQKISPEEYLKLERAAEYKSDYAVGFYGYPDVSIVSGKGEFEDEDNLLNPTVLVEVLSENTVAYDRCKKFEFYQKIPTLREFLFIADDHYLVEQYVRIDNRIWQLTFGDRLHDVVQLPSLDCEFALKEIYHKVKFK